MTALTLASRSAARAAILRGAGVDFEVADSGVDEDAVKAALLEMGATPLLVATELAAAKAMRASKDRRGLVIGADQTLEMDGVLHDKATSFQEAWWRLTALRGRAHALHAAVALARDGDVVWRLTDTARLTMRAFSDDFLRAYLERAGAAILDSVGCYQMEGEGAQLFEAVEGDYFSILGLPLVPLLGALRSQDALAR